MICRSKNPGFTLIELSIVLVIIGLIGGGILIGRDLIQQAEIRRTVSQVEQFNIAASTFKNKYSCLPGDCPEATKFGFDAGTDGDGNEIIGQRHGGECDIIPSQCPDVITQEYINFWYHLGAAALISNGLPPYVPGQDVYTYYKAGSMTPPVDIRPVIGGNYTLGWIIAADIEVDVSRIPPHNFLLGTHPFVFMNQYSHYAVSTIYAVDKKMDDGLPKLGKVVAWWFGRQLHLSLPNSSRCIINDSEYNVTYTGPYTQIPSTPLYLGTCSIAIKTTF